MCRNCGSDDFENGFEFECPKYRKNKIYRIIESYNRYRGRKRWKPWVKWLFLTKICCEYNHARIN